MARNLRLGTRGSPLAIVQAREVAAALEAAQGWPEGRIEIVPIVTTGDVITDRPLAEVGGKSLWTKELDFALMAGTVDCTVHSMKDVEVDRPAEICLAAIRPRHHWLDVLIGADSIDALHDGAVVGTSSPRRVAQLLALRPDLAVVPIRGNVDTRLRKLAAGEVHATLLSAAGLHRLGKGDIGTALPATVMLPAPGQGAVGVEMRADDGEGLLMMASIDDATTRCMIEAERAFAQALGGSCRSPVAALARFEGGLVQLDAEILSADGRERVRDQARFDSADCRQGAKLARAMLSRAPESIRQLFRPA